MHIQITFNNISDTIKELLIAELADIAEGFEETDTDLHAFFMKEKYDREAVTSLAALHNITFTENEITPQNWNALWESNFEPVIVENFVGVRAFFHAPIPDVQHEIIITPKMSFGTGHHATTYLMIQQMQQIDFKGKTVFDFGTGTGILAILAAKLGAQQITANDIDEWSIQNARENFEANNVTDIRLVHSDSGMMAEHFDIILANINRNVLLENISHLSNQLNNNGLLILSGILREDIAIIEQCCKNNHLSLSGQAEKSNWMCLSFKKL